ncbi:thioesterase II family protein [Niastella populi]|uniref:Thioesterase n=1 Tax=Niastella populi TaxID=550983 RepID=A0A1V9EJJ3_9BACT|nr:alpha/beta fold hydrolase [Niastella populi]OQP46299.1 thioesterase [Niastella populi]
MIFGKNMQVFLLHFSGGSVNSFNFLKPFLPKYFEFHPLELPGRGKRIKEKLLSVESEAIDDLINQINSLRNNKPYIIFGHSLGAQLGLRVTKKLEELGDSPKKLIVAGNAGPGTGNIDKCRSTISDEELKEELLSLGGVPKEVLENDELFGFFSPIMRSDFKILEKGEPLEAGFKLNTPIVAVMGDKEETVEDIENWRNFTTGTFKSYILEGNHFFIHDHPAELVRIITNSYD